VDIVVAVVDKSIVFVVFFAVVGAVVVGVEVGAAVLGVVVAIGVVVTSILFAVVVIVLVGVVVESTATVFVGMGEGCAIVVVSSVVFLLTAGVLSPLFSISP